LVKKTYKNEHISINIVFSIIIENNENMEIKSDLGLVPVINGLRRLAEDTGAFGIARVVQGNRGRGPGAKRPWDLDITLCLHHSGRKVHLGVISRRNLSPAGVLQLHTRIFGKANTGMLLVHAPYLSARVREVCRDHGINFMDGVGNCRIAGPGLFVSVEGRDNHPPALGEIDPFSKKSSRIVRTLLDHPGKGWQVQQLAKLAQVSLGLSSRVKTALLAEAYLEERDRLVFVRDPGKLLQAWSAVYRPQVRRVALFALPPPAEIWRRLAAWSAENHVRCGLTQLAAAWCYAPSVRPDRTVAYLDAEVEMDGRLGSLLGSLEAREVDSGANCVLWLTEDPSLFQGAREFDGIPVVSPLQTYLDLQALTGRSREAASEVMSRFLDVEPHSQQEGARHDRS
jgi:hypothetical protein